jgi:hypothetical protein
VKANPQVRKIELVIRWITRILSGMLVLFNGAYILLAILMITAAGEELFPKMTFSFLALSLLSIALLASWRWQTLGAFAIVAALLAYRMAERSRLGYEPKWSWFSTCPGRIFPSVRQLEHMTVSQLRATGSRDASHPVRGERWPARSPMAQPPAVAGMGFSAQAPDGVVRD